MHQTTPRGLWSIYQQIRWICPNWSFDTFEFHVVIWRWYTLLGLADLYRCRGTSNGLLYSSLYPGYQKQILPPSVLRKMDEGFQEHYWSFSENWWSLSIIPRLPIYWCEVEIDVESTIPLLWLSDYFGVRSLLEKVLERIKKVSKPTTWSTLAEEANKLGIYELLKSHHRKFKRTQRRVAD